MLNNKAGIVHLILLILVAVVLAASAWYVGAHLSTGNRAVSPISSSAALKTASESASPISYSGIQINDRTVSFAVIGKRIILRYEGKFYGQDENGEPKQIVLVNHDQYKWYGLVDRPEGVAIDPYYDQIFSFKVFPDGKRFIFVMRFSELAGDHSFLQRFKTYYFNPDKKGGEVSKIMDVPYVNFVSFVIPKIDKISDDGKTVSFNMYQCWNCGDPPAEKRVLDTSSF